jgi:hypothetical protein
MSSTFLPVGPMQGTYGAWLDNHSGLLYLGYGLKVKTRFLPEAVLFEAETNASSCDGRLLSSSTSVSNVLP